MNVPSVREALRPMVSSGLRYRASNRNVLRGGWVRILDLRWVFTDDVTRAD